MQDTPTGLPGYPGEAPTTDSLLTGAPPSLTLEPRSAAAPAVVQAAGQASRPPLSPEAVRARCAAAPLPPPRRKLLEGVALLWHDHWDEAHRLAQAREGQSDYDLLHAMGHRREGDYPNAEYWFRSAGRHPCHTLLERSSEAILPPGHPLRKTLLPGDRWSPKAFVTEVRRNGGVTGENAELLIRLQALEFRAFSDWLLSA